MILPIKGHKLSLIDMCQKNGYPVNETLKF